MVVSISPWLENADCAPANSSKGIEAGSGIGLSRDSEVEEILCEAASLRESHNGESFNGMDFYHEPVLAREVLEALQPSEGKQIYDGTLGGGGHSELLLAHGAHVIGSDRDEDALRYTTARLSRRFEDRFLPLQGNFADMDRLLMEVGIDRVDGILLDLGVSSYQLDEATRGFSFRNEGPLDMRMNQASGPTAADIVNQSPEEELIQIFRNFGEERKAGSVARHIVRERDHRKFETTMQLAEAVASVIPKTGKNHPATRVFQALRIAVNEELACLESALEKSINLLGSGGVLAVITFHSLEDRIVKQFMRKHSEKELDRPEWPEPRPNPDYCLELPHRKPKSPEEDELAANARSRSAKLRVARKI